MRQQQQPRYPSRNDEIRAAATAGQRQADIARAHGISPARVSVIVNGRRRRAPMSAADRVYVVRSGPFIKIGVTKDVPWRFRSLVMTVPYPLECLGTFIGGREAEADFHRRFQSCHHRGEWFIETPDMRSALAAILIPPDWNPPLRSM